MKKLFYLLLLLLFTISLPAQKIGIRKMILVTDITDTNRNILTGYLHSVTDTGINIMDVKKPVYSKLENMRLYKVDPGMIRVVTMKKSRQALKGAALGMLAGAIAGAIVGLASYRDTSPDDLFDFGPAFDAVGGGGIGMLIGGVTGLAIGIHPKKYKVNGDRNNYKRMQLRFYDRISLRGGANQ